MTGRRNTWETISRHKIPNRNYWNKVKKKKGKRKKLCLNFDPSLSLSLSLRLIVHHNRSSVHFYDSGQFLSLSLGAGYRANTISHATVFLLFPPLLKASHEEFWSFVLGGFILLFLLSLAFILMWGSSLSLQACFFTSGSLSCFGSASDLTQSHDSVMKIEFSFNLPMIIAS